MSSGSERPAERWISRYYLLLCIVVFFLAVATSVYSSTYNLTVNEISAVKGDKITRMPVVSKPVGTMVLDAVSIFLYTLSASIFISVYIIKRIESASSERRENEIKMLHSSINENIFDALFKTLMPDDIYESIKRDVVQRKLVRKNAQLLFDFSIVEGTIVLNQTIMYELHNVSGNKHRQSFNPRFAHTETNEISLKKMVCTNDDGVVIIDYDATNTAKQKGIKSTDNTENDFRLEYEIELSDKGHVDIRFMILNKYVSSSCVQDEYFTSDPLSDLTLTDRKSVV